MAAHQNIGFPTLYDDQKGQKTHNSSEAEALRRHTGENVEGYTASTSGHATHRILGASEDWANAEGLG